MRILFLNPPFLGRFSRSSRSPAVTRGGTLYYPLWLAYATGVAEKDGHDALLLDAPANNLSLSDTLTAAADFVPDLIVVDSSTPSIYSDVNTATLLKEKIPSCFLLLVGTHPSALPESTMALSTAIDAVAIGEYDNTVRDLARALDTAKPLAHLKGIVYRDDAAIHRNPPRDKITDLDSIPFVSKTYKKFLCVKNYFFAAANYPMVMIITGRGCPFRCFFCVYPQVFHGRAYRPRSPENVAAEFRYIRDQMPDIKEIGIEDDCFTANQKRAAKICELLIEQNNSLPWYCNVRGDVKYDLLRLMKQAGCRLVTVGFESADQKVLNNINKDETVSGYMRFARDCRRADILIHGCIMTGNPGDSRETLHAGYEFAKTINCDSIQFYPLYVYPGTEAYEWAKENGYLKTEDYSQWLTPEGNYNCVIDTPDLSAEEMVDLCQNYLKKYHLRPSYLAYKIAQAFRHPGEGLRSLKSARTFFQGLVTQRIKRDPSGCR